MSNNLSPNIGTFITYKEVTGEHINVADAVHLLSRLNIHGVLRMVAMLNACLVKPYASPPEMRQLNNKLVPLMFSQELQEKLRQSLFGSDNNVVVFHRQQQLLMLRLALMACPHTRGQPWDETAMQTFAEACLMVNDIVGTREEEITAAGQRLGFASQILPISELPSDDELASLVGRSLELWLHLPSDPALQTEKDYVPWSERFLDHYGISLEQFIHGLFIVVARCETFDPNQENPIQALVINAKTHLGKSRFPQRIFEAILNIVSCKLSTLRDMQVTEATQSLRHDFSLLRRYPLIEVEAGVYLCYDRNFLRRYFTDGIYWLIYNLLPPKERDSFQSFFGKVFAAYVEKLLNHLYSEGPAAATHLLKTKLHFAKNQGEVCDALIAVEDSWILMEVKGSLLTTRAKYSGDGMLLEQDLRDRFVESRKGDKKGVGQLARSIEKLTTGMLTNAPELQLTACKKIYPVIVAYDSAVTALFIPEYLETELKTALGTLSPPPAVRPLTVVSIADLELLTAIKCSPKLNDVLASYYHQQRPAESFGAFLSRHFRGQIDVENSQFFQNFNAICDAAIHYFD